MQMENCAQLLARRSRIMQTTLKICASFFGVAHSLLFLASGHASVHGHPPKGECKMRIFMGWGRSNVRQFNVGWHTNPQSSHRLLLPLPTPLNSPFCAQSLLLHVTYDTCSHCPTWQSHMYVRRVHCYARPMAMQIGPGCEASRNNPLRMHWTLLVQADCNVAYA